MNVIDCMDAVLDHDSSKSPPVSVVSSMGSSKFISNVMMALLVGSFCDHA
jgi:hypothetical protein